MTQTIPPSATGMADTYRLPIDELPGLSKAIADAWHEGGCHSVGSVYDALRHNVDVFGIRDARKIMTIEALQQNGVWDTNCVESVDSYLRAAEAAYAVGVKVGIEHQRKGPHRFSTDDYGRNKLQELLNQAIADGLKHVTLDVRLTYDVPDLFGFSADADLSLPTKRIAHLLVGWDLDSSRKLVDEAVLSVGREEWKCLAEFDAGRGKGHLVIGAQQEQAEEAPARPPHAAVG